MRINHWSLTSFPGPRSHGLLLIAAIVWAGVIVGGWELMAREEFSPVQAALPTKMFAEGSSLQLSRDKPTMLLFVHPLCPCTRASFHELGELLAETKGEVSTTIIFSVAPGLPSEWKQGNLWRSAKTFHDVHVVEDAGGIEARRFGVTGSGHCLLYSRSGVLLFSGGITGSRGHEGENRGRLALRSLITTGRTDISSTPVFGCSLM